MWAVWTFRRWTLAYRPIRGVTARFPTDDIGVSFTVLWVTLSSDDLAHGQRLITDAEAFVTDVRRFDVKDKFFGTFQLESLILAQNERWRQA
jgi:hypothetical protein